MFIICMPEPRKVRKEWQMPLVCCEEKVKTKSGCKGAGDTLIPNVIYNSKSINKLKMFTFGSYIQHSITESDGQRKWTKPKKHVNQKNYLCS